MLLRLLSFGTKSVPLEHCSPERKVKKRGCRIIFVSGEGIGAIATGLLDENGYLTEIRVKKGGYGYKINDPESNGFVQS